MGDNPTENNQKLLRNQEKTLTGSKLNGDWRGNQCDLLGKINHLCWRSTLLRKYELRWGRQKLCRGKQHAAGYLNQPNQLGTRKEIPLRIKHSAEELNQHKRLGIPEGLTAWGTFDVSHLRTCYPSKCCWYFFLIALKNSCFYIFKKNWFWLKI